MLINILLGLISVALLVYLAVQFYGESKSPRRIAAEEFENERKRRERRADNLRAIQEHVDGRCEELAQAVKEIVSELGPDSGLVVERDGRTVRVEAGDVWYSVVFRLPEYDLDARNLDVQAYANAYGRYVMETEKDWLEFDSLDGVVRFLAREFARKAGG